METSQGICEGLRVIEMGAGSIGASVAAMMLADHGATVVKVEPPRGDRLRASNPSGFQVWNRGKQSLVADLRTGNGQATVVDLIRGADVVIEAFAAGRANAWSLAYAELSRPNPALVYCAIKGFPSRGRYASLPGYDGIVAAKVGFWNLEKLGGRPGATFSAVPIASFAVGHLALGGILAALIVRQRTGRGQYVEATMVQGLSVYDYLGTSNWQYSARQIPSGNGPSSPTAAGVARIYALAPTGDGQWLSFTYVAPRSARAVAAALGIEHLLDDPRFAAVPRFPSEEAAREWDVALCRAVSSRTYAEWEPVLLADSEIGFERVGTGEEALDHPQVRAGTVTVADPDLGPLEQLGPLSTFEQTPARIRASAPRLGEHSRLDWTPRDLATGAFEKEHPLADFTIVDFGYFFPAPFGVALAGSLGARVIKLESLAGDPMRTSFGAVDVSSAKPMEGKESIAVDLGRPEGREIARRLVTMADLFMDGLRPGAAQRLGLGREEIRQISPSIVHVSARGYGGEGPYQNRPVFSRTASALAGLVHRHAGSWLHPAVVADLEPDRVVDEVAPKLMAPLDGDGHAALGVFSTIMLGLFDLACRGRGQCAEASMVFSSLHANGDDACRYDGKPSVRLPDPGQYGLGALYRLYRAQDGWVFLAAPSQIKFAALAEALGHEEWIDDPRFAAAEARAVNDTELVDELAATLSGRSAAQIEYLLLRAGVACVEVFNGQHAEFACTDPAMRADELTVEVDHPVFGPTLRHGLPVQLSVTPGRVAPPCRLGQHTCELLAELGYSPEEISALEADGVICTHP